MNELRRDYIVMLLVHRAPWIRLTLLALVALAVFTAILA